MGHTKALRSLREPMSALSLTISSSILTISFIKRRPSICSDKFIYTLNGLNSMRVAWVSLTSDNDRWCAQMITDLAIPILDKTGKYDSIHSTARRASYGRSKLDSSPERWIMRIVWYIGTLNKIQAAISAKV